MSTGGRGTYSITIQIQGGAQAKAQIDQLKTSLTSLNTVGQPLSQAEGSLARLSTSANTAQLSVRQLVGTVGPLSNSLSGAAAGTTKLSGSLANLNSRVTGVTGGLSRTNTLANQGAGSMNKLASETEKASRSSIGMASNIRGMIVPLVGLGSAGIEAIGMFQAYQDTSRNVEEAQNKVNEAVKKFGPDSKEARDATQQLEQAQRGLQFILRNTIQSISDIGIFLALIANSFLKMRTSTVAATTANAGLIASNTGVATSMGAVTTTTNAAGGALTRFTGILRAIPLALGPIGIAFAAIGATVAAFTALYSQNIGGIRESTNSFGAAVGDAIPILRPFGDLLVGVAGQLGLTGESAERTAEHMRNATTGFQEMGSLWQQTLDNISNGFMEWGFNVQQGFGLVVDSFSNFFGQIGDQLGQWLGELGGSIQRGFDNVFGPLLGQATDIAQGIAGELNNFGQWLTETSVDILESLGIDRDQLVKDAEQIGREIGAAIGLGLGAAGEFLTGGLKAGQEPGASGNIGQGESFQDTSIVEQIFGVKPRNAEDITGTSGGIKPGLVPSGQTWQDFLNAQRPSSAEEILGLSPKGGAAGITGQPPQSRILDLTGATQQFAKQAAVDKIIEDQLKDQATAAEQAGDAWAFLTKNHDLDTVASLNLKDAQELLFNEGITVGEGALENLQEAQTAINKALEDGVIDAEENKQIQTALAGETVKGTKAVEERETAIQKLRASNEDLTLSLGDTAAAIKNESLMQELSRQGTLEAQQAIVDYGGELIKNTAFNKEWGAAIDSNVFKQAAFRTGVQEQVAALNDSKVELLESQGALSEYNRQIALGIPQEIARQQAITDTARALNDTDVEVASTTGHIQEMNRQLSTGRPQQQAYSQGWQEVALGMQSTELEIAGTMGQVDAMNAALQTGVPQLHAYTQGWLSVQQGLQESIIGLAEARGEIESMNAALEKGIPQGIAFLEGINNITQAEQEMVVETARLAGETQRMGQSLGSVEQAQLRTVNGFLQGTRAAQDFIAEIDTASGSAVGYRQTLEEAANAAGIQLPQGINTSTESLERQIAIFKGSVPVIQEYANQINEAGNTLGTMFSPEKLKDINDEVDDWADNLRKQWDVKITKNLEEGISQMNLEGAFETELNELSGLLIGMIGRGEFQDAGKAIMDHLSNGVEGAGPQFQASVAATMDAVRQVIANCGGSGGSSQGCASALEGLNNALATFNDNVSTAMDGAKQSVSSLADTMVKEFGRGAEAVDQIIDKLKEVSAAKLGPGVNPRATEILSQSQLLDEFTEPGGAFEGQAKPDFAADQLATVDTAAATQSLDQLRQHALQVIGEINTAFTSFSQTWPPLVATAVTLVNEQLNLLGQNAQLVVGQMNLAFTSLGQTWPPIIASAVEAVNAQLQTLSQGVQLAVGQMNLAFSSIAQTWPQIMSSTVSSVSASMQQLSAATQQAVGQMNTAFSSIQQTWPQIMQSTMDSVVSIVQSGVQQMVSHLNQVTTAFNEIGAAANSAAGEVDALRQAVESVPTERTITFNVQVTGDSIPSGGTLSAAGGLGRHGGVDYLPLASGSGGVSGLGFDPILIDHPTNILVGENGPELVAVTPLNNNGVGRTGEKSPFGSMKLAGGSDEMFSQGNTAATKIQTQSVTFDQNQGPIQILNEGAGGTLTPGSAGLPNSFNNNNVGLGTGQGGIFNVPGGQGAISGNATVCINGQCFGNTQGLGAPIGSTNQQQLGQQAFTPVFDETGSIKAIETLVEWFKFLGLPTGASIPGTGQTTAPIPATQGTITGRGAFASTGQGAFAGTINMQGGQVMFDSNQGDMELQTSTGAISIAGQGGAFARAGNAIASAGNVGLFGSQENQQLTQLNRTMNEVSGSMQAVGNSMASLGDEIVFGNEQAQQTFQGLNTNLQGLTTTTQQGLQNVVNGVSLFGAGNQVGFQGFTLPNGQQGGAVGAGGAANNPLGFLSGMLGGFGINNPFQGATPTGGGTGTGGGTIGTGGCNVCGAATGLGNAATDLSGAAGQLGDAVGQMPNGNGTMGGSIPTGGNLGIGNGTMGGTTPGTGAGCECSCMPMDSDPNRYKIEDGSGNDCNDHIYFDTIEECHSRLNEICPGENTTNPTPTNPTPTNPAPTPTTPGVPGIPSFPPGVSVSGPGAIACVNGQCFGAGGAITTGGAGQVPGQGQPGMPIGNPPEPPRIVQEAGLPSQAPDVNQDPTSWTIVESAGLVGTYDIIDDNGNVVQLGFRTLSDAETYLNYFISYYEWVESGSTGIPGPVPVGGGITGGVGTGGGINVGTGGGITAGGGGVQAIAGGGGAFAQAGNAVAQAGSFLGSGFGMGEKALGPRKIDTNIPLLESIPRAQGPFRSGQDNQEPIYDNSGIKIGADFGTPLEGATSMQDVEEGPKVKRNVRDRVQRHLNTALAIAGDYADLKQAIINAITSAFGDIMLNLNVNSMLDGNSIHKNQQKYQVKNVSLFT